MTVKVSSYFQHRWTVFWATTYTFELPMFDSFWFPRLGEPPLNVTILVDARRLAATWSLLPPDETSRLQRANRQYLIRGVPVPGGAFHPKTYVFGNGQEGVLLVGSGNLGLHGLEDGQELFSVFTSSTSEGIAALRGWRDWMELVVQHYDDPQVTMRWLDLKSRIPWLAGTAGHSSFVTNWKQPLAPQLTTGITPPVDELHILAPFFDQEATALAELIAVTRPRALHLYISKDASVDGARLHAVVQASQATVHVTGFDEFVHAKLVGIVTGTHGRLLSGSANLSRAALLRSAVEGGGNIEAGVLLDLPANAVRTAFTPSRSQSRALSLDDLVHLHFQPSSDAPPLPLTLLSAVRFPDGRITVRVRGTSPNESIALTNGPTTITLAGDQTTAPFPLPDNGALVWVTAPTGQAVSNCVPVDDPTRLNEWLQQRGTTVERPRELDERDVTTPVGQMLQRLNQACIFDIDETPAAARAQRLQDIDADPTFWDRLLQEELRLDPRASAYVLRVGQTRLDDDDVLELLRRMLDEAPQRARLRLLKQDSVPRDASGVAIGTPWQPDRRLQVRLYNVLDRWSRSLADPRIRWINPLTPARNYTGLLAALLECWTERYLSEERLLALTASLFGSFIRTERSPGYLMALPEGERHAAITALDDLTRAGTAALLYVGLRNTANWRGHIFDWQAFLLPALDLGIVLDDAAAAAAASLIVGGAVTVTDVSDRLLWAALYMDDQQWGPTMARELNLTKVELTTDNFNENFGVTMRVSGLTDPLGDPRLVTLARKAFEYRKATGGVITLPEGRVSVQLGERVYAKLEGIQFESSQTVTVEGMKLLEANGAGFRALHATTTERAA